jgi:hypothetical protein
MNPPFWDATTLEVPPSGQLSAEALRDFLPTWTEDTYDQQGYESSECLSYRQGWIPVVTHPRPTGHG